MRPDVKINDLWMFAMGWLREEIDFPTPQSQTNTVVVPGRNAPIRFTEANQMKDVLANLYAGQLCHVILSEEPELYAVGTLELEPAYDPLTGKGQMVLSCSDGDAYRYHTEETEVSITGGGTAILNNDYMPVVPTVVTTAETALSWSIGEDVFRKSVSAGTWTFPELELQEGQNSVSITGEGTTTFRYREGRL